MKRSEFIESAAANNLDSVVVEVRTRFVADFPIRCDLAVSLVDEVASREGQERSATSLRELAHRLAGLAGIIGFQRVSALASDLESLAADAETGAFKAADAHALVDSLRAAFAQELGGPAPSSPEIQKKVDRGRVLVAEDDDDQRSIVVQRLTEAGYSVEGVSAGSMVMRAARATPPSVVLLDVEMPGLDGYSVCRELKADASLATVPVMFMTSRARLDDRLVGLTLGADDYLVKPVDPRELIIRLDRVRSRGTVRAEQSAADGVLSYEDFLSVARSRLTRSSASVSLIRVPPEHLNGAAATLRAETRRADLVATYNRNHLLLLLPDLNGATARIRTTEMIARLGETGVNSAAAGIACAPAASAVWIESLICDADEALMQARQSGAAVAVFGDRADASAAPAGGSVLIADDDPDVVRILDAQLRGAGYRTTLAFDGAEALAVLQRGRFDALILDLMMPKLGGFDLLGRINRGDPARPKVVVLSARGREDDVTRAFELGADDYVTKPFNPQELLARVARLMR
jgi:DNA-binding response OmpR family regulator